MITEDQTNTIAFLAAPSTHDGAAVEQIETHASIVFLAGDRALKLKRAVRYDYLDFSTVDRRRQMCEAEVCINRRTAPALYRGVVAVTRETDGSLKLGGTGTPVDWLVEMARFDQDALADRLAERDALDPHLMRPLAAAIAHLHANASCRRDQGGAEAMAWVIDGNAAGFSEHGHGIFDSTACARYVHRLRHVFGLQSVLLDDRRETDMVRQCHGDLHLRNIVLIDGHPTLFDAIEFNDRISCVDVLYDLAFLLMDLWRRNMPRHANVLWNAYLTETADFGGLPLLPLFLSCRAAVAAKTSATAAALQTDPARRLALQQQARDYLALAASLIEPPRPCLIAVGGLSGSGKSTLAAAVAPVVGGAPGSVIVRSDEIRKKLCGAKPFERLGPQGYTAQISGRVYTALRERADAVVRSGHAAIVDAVFAHGADRAAIQHVAHEAGVPFVGLWLDAPPPVLIARVEARGADVSDADAEVIRRQLAEQKDPIGWHRLDASATLPFVLESTIPYLFEAGGCNTLSTSSIATSAAAAQR